MRFLHLIRSIRLEGGGPAEHLRLLMKSYQQAGHVAEITSLDPPGTPVTGFSAPVHLLGRRSDGYGYSPLLRPWLRQNAQNFDGVVVDGLWQYHGYAALRELRGLHPYAVFPHGMLDPWFNRTYPLKKLKKLPYWALVEGPMLRGSEAVLFTSSVERDLAPQSFPWSRWHSEVVPFGTSGPPGDAAEEIAAFRTQVPQVGEDPFLLFAGRLHPKKGCDLLLQAYAAVHEKTPLPKLVFAGPDSVGWQAELQRLAEALGVAKRVVWAGMLLGAEKWGAFRAAEALVLPSHQENFGIVVAEALSCGTPVLISNQVNIFQDVQRHAAGLVEPDTLVGTMRLLSAWGELSQEQQQQMSHRAEACWRACFDSSRTPAAIAGIFTATK